MHVLYMATRRLISVESAWSWTPSRSLDLFPRWAAELGVHDWFAPTRPSIGSGFLQLKLAHQVQKLDTSKCTVSKSAGMSAVAQCCKEINFFAMVSFVVRLDIIML